MENCENSLLKLHNFLQMSKSNSGSVHFNHQNISTIQYNTGEPRIMIVKKNYFEYFVMGLIWIYY